MDVNQYDSNGRALIHKFTMFGEFQALRVLLQRPDIDVNNLTLADEEDEWNDMDFSPLMLTADKEGPEYCEIMKLLLARPDTKINLVNNWGKTALILAAQGNSLEVNLFKIT